jgi:hypothetical protein
VTGQRRQRGHTVEDHGGQPVLLGREVPEHRPLPDAGPAGDVGDRRFGPVLGELGLRRGQQGGAVAGELVLDVDGTLGGMASVAALTTTIGAEYTLDDGVRALTAFADRHTTGKVVVKI